MANPPAPLSKSDALLMAKQVGGAWACGSVFLGTVAVLFLTSENAPLLGLPIAVPAQTCPRPVISEPCPGPSLYQLTPLERLAAVALVGALFVSLGLLLWRTAAATWLSADTRARLLWVILVGLGGLAGWSFAATVTFAVGFSPLTQGILAYLAGGLPFGLVAGMLLRPWRANVASIALSAALVMAGFLMVAGRSPVYPQNVFALYAHYAQSFFSGRGVVVY